MATKIVNGTLIPTMLSIQNSSSRLAFRALGALLLHVIEEEIFRKNLDRPKKINELLTEILSIKVNEFGEEKLREVSANTSATWNEWKKPAGKGCFASADIEMAKRLVSEASRLDLLNRPEIPTSQARDALEVSFEEFTAEEFVSALESVSSLCWLEDPDDYDFEEVYTLIFNMARMYHDDKTWQFLDIERLCPMSRVNKVVKLEVGDQSKLTARELERIRLRTNTMVAGCMALGAVGELSYDVLLCADYFKGDSKFHKGRLTSTFRLTAKELRLKASMSPPRYALLNKQKLTKIHTYIDVAVMFQVLELRLIADAEDLALRTSMYCDQLSEGDFKLSKEKQIALLSKVAGSLASESRRLQRKK